MSITLFTAKNLIRVTLGNILRKLVKFLISRDVQGVRPKLLCHQKFWECPCPDSEARPPSQFLRFFWGIFWKISGF